MLKIIIEDKYSLRLPVNFEIQIVEENPLLTEDNIPAAYSLSFELDTDVEVLKIFGYPNRPSSNTVKKKVRARIISGIIPYSAGELLLLGYDQKLKFQYKGSIETLGLVTPLNEIYIDEKNLGFCPVYAENMNYNDSWAVQYRDYMNNQVLNQTDFAVGPVRLADTNWEGTGYTLGSKNTLRTYQNFWDPRHPSDGFLLDCQNTNPDDSKNRMHTPVMPYPYLKDLIGSAFGNLLDENPFTEGDFAKLCIISENHPNLQLGRLYQFYMQYINEDYSYQRDVMFPLIDSYSVSELIGGISYHPLKFKLQSFMQAYKFNEFLKNVLKIFGMSAYPGTKYQIIKDDEIFNRDAVISLDKYLVGELAIDYDEIDCEYVFEYKNGDNSEDVFRKVNNLSEATNHLLLGGTEFLQEQEYQDLNTNEVFTLKKTLRGLANIPWIEEKIKRSALVQKTDETKEEKFTVTSEVTPLEMSVEQYWWQNEAPTILVGEGIGAHYESDLIERKHWHVPLLPKENITAAPHLMLSYGMCQTLSNSNHYYPLITNHNIDCFGQRRGDLSLLPNGPDGIVQKCQSYKKKWIEKRKMTAKGAFALPEVINKNLQIKDKVHLQGRLFLIKIREYSLTHQGISLVDMELIEDL